MSSQPSLVPRRRKRPEHVPGTSLSVISPEIAEVMVVETGVHQPVQVAIGSDYAELIKLRLEIRTAQHHGRELFRCSICGVGVYLCRTKNEQRFFFKHRHEDGSCPAITRGGLSQKELDARRYNGAKESALHLKMKEWVAQCLRADSSFSQIEVEPRWTGAIDGTWRRPDVRAVLNGLPIAFEVQLSTTYLNVIAERRQFYLQEHGLLFWIFAVFDNEHRRMTEEDVFYNNNQNAFVVTESTVDQSRREGRFLLECVWTEPTRGGDTSNFHRKTISFHDLTLDPSTQRAYYFDFEGRRQQYRLEAQQDEQRLRDDFEAWWGRYSEVGSGWVNEWDSFRPRFVKLGIAAPPYHNWLPANDLTALYSAKHNRPWGQRRHLLVEVAHQVASNHTECLVWFMHAVRKYGRLESMKLEGDPFKWRMKYESRQAEFKAHPERFNRKSKYDDLIRFLFPELCPFPPATHTYRVSLVK